MSLSTRAPGDARGLRALAIGASAGGFDALRQVLPALRTPSLTVIVVVHQLPHGSSNLASLFADIAALPCGVPDDKDPALPGVIHFAPAGYHLLVEREGYFALSLEPPVNYSRPSIDVLFESAADVWGPALAGLVLTGANEDGARGLKRIGEAGGLTLVQDPAEAEARTMPAAACAIAQPRAVMRLSELAALFRSWSAEEEHA